MKLSQTLEGALQGVKRHWKSEGRARGAYTLGLEVSADGRSWPGQRDSGLGPQGQRGAD